MSHPVINCASFAQLATNLHANTHFEYMYRDADNYKQYRSAVFRGPLTLDQAEKLLEALDKDDGFVPSAVGLADLQEQMVTAWDPDVDHPFHEVSELALTLGAPTEAQTAEEFLAAFTRQDWSAAAQVVEARMGTVGAG